MTFKLPTKAQFIDILKRSAVTFAAAFITSAAVAIDAAPSLTVGVLVSVGAAAAVAAVNVVIRMIWKPALESYAPALTVVTGSGNTVAPPPAP